jgi:tRNA nucleotidyltransferase/poly(A) polymerase
MVGNAPERTLKSPERARIDPEGLPERLSALAGLGRVREAAAGTPVYLVGGAVRDLLLGWERTDLDIVVEGDAAELGQRLGGEVHAHERFATARVRTDELELDLATARSESYPAPCPRSGPPPWPRTWPAATSRSTRWRSPSRAMRR